MAIYHDVRVDRSAPVRKPTPTRAERRVDPDGQNLISVLHTLYTSNRDFKTRVNEAMRAAFGEDFEEILFPPAADTVIQMRVRWKSLRREQPAADLSDGTLRFLFLLAVLGSPSPAPVIAIEEPETGLHPAMLPIVAEQAVEASNRSQVILTTHSPQVLDAFGDVKPTTTVVGPGLPRAGVGHTLHRDDADDRMVSARIGKRRARPTCARPSKRVRGCRACAGAWKEERNVRQQHRGTDRRQLRRRGDELDGDGAR